MAAATLELLVGGKVQEVGKYFSEDYVAHVTEQDVRGGHELVRSVIGMYRKAFSDLSAEVVVFMESADTVAWRRTMRARQSGPFKGFPGTGLPIVWHEMVVSRVVASRIAEEWIVTDLAERLLLGRKSVSSRRAASKALMPRGDAYPLVQAEPQRQGAGPARWCCLSSSAPAWRLAAAARLTRTLGLT